METDALRQIKRFPNHLSWRLCAQTRFGVPSVPLAMQLVMPGAHVALVLA